MVKNKSIASNDRWYNQHYWSLLLGLGSLLVAYLIASRALNTGSWQQYGIAIVCIVFGLNRLGRAAHTTAKNLWAMLSRNKG